MPETTREISEEQALTEIKHVEGIQNATGKAIWVAIGKKIATLKQQLNKLAEDSPAETEISEEQALTEIQLVPGITQATGKAIWVAMGRYIAELKQQIDKPKQKRITFKEAVKFLEGKFDLEQERKKAVEAHVRWGIVDVLIEIGAIKDVEEYNKLFDSITIDQTDLRDIRGMIERGEEITPIFDPGKLTPNDMFATIIASLSNDRGVPDYNHLGYKLLRLIRKIEQKDIPELNGVRVGNDTEKLKEAYRIAKPIRPTGPRLVFVTNNPNNTQERDLTAILEGHSITEDLEAIRIVGLKFIDPIADFIRIRTLLDEKLRTVTSQSIDFDRLTRGNYNELLRRARSARIIDMPTTRTFTHYPSYIDKSGNVSGIGCIESQEFSILTCNLSQPTYSKSRILLG